jgi:hypothetical protein
MGIFSVSANGCRKSINNYSDENISILLSGYMVQIPGYSHVSQKG